MDLRVRLHRDDGGEVRADDEWGLFPVFDLGDRRRIMKAADDIVRDRLRGLPGKAQISPAAPQQAGYSSP